MRLGRGLLEILRCLDGGFWRLPGRRTRSPSVILPAPKTFGVKTIRVLLPPAADQIRHLKLKTHPKMAKKSSNPIKGYFAQKIPNFFSGRFYRKSLENPAKTAKKTPQKGSKKWRFLTRFRQRQFVNQSQIRKRQFRDSLPRLLREQVIQRLLLPSCRDGGTSSPTGKVRQIYFLEMVIHFRQFIRLLILWM